MERVMERCFAAAVVLAAVMLGFGAAADAKDCTRTTPLPSDTKFSAPSERVPAEVTRFAGAWIGAWKDRNADDAQCHTLVVE